MSSLTQLNNAITTEYASNSGVYATALRASVSAIYLNEAPPGTPYPIIIFEDISSQITYTSCSLVELIPIDFTVFAETKDQSLGLAYNLQKLYDSNTFTLSAGYVNNGAIYDGSFSDYDVNDNIFFAKASINYTIVSPDEGYTPIPPDVYGSREFTFDMQAPIEFTEKSTTLVGADVTIDDAVAKAGTAGTAESIYNVYQNDTVIGTITFAIGSTTGVPAISSTAFVEGDFVGVFCETPATDIEMVDITITGIGY